MKLEFHNTSFSFSWTSKSNLEVSIVWVLTKTLCVFTFAPFLPSGFNKFT